MKKLALILVAAMAMTLSGTAFATDTATYQDETNNVSVVDASGYSTVLIAKGSDAYSAEASDIVFVDQADSTFTATVNFMLKGNALEDGEYTVLLGNGQKQNKTLSFTIGQIPDTSVDLPMPALSGNGSYAEGYKNLAFAAAAVNIGEYNAIKVVIDENGAAPLVGGFKLSDLDLPTISEGTQINFGLQINNVPDEYTNRITVYLSNYTSVAEGSPWTQEGE